MKLGLTGVISFMMAWLLATSVAADTLCPEGTTLFMTGRVRVARPGCSDGAVYINKSRDTTCSTVSAPIPEPTIPPPVDVPHSAVCIDQPLPRTRIELWQDNGAQGASTGDRLLTAGA